MEEIIIVNMVYVRNTIIFFVSIIPRLLFSIPFIMFRELSNGNSSHIFENVFPISSFGKYIPLVKHTSCTIMLPTPPVAFSLTRLPISIPRVINRIDIMMDISIAYIMFMLKLSPRRIATRKKRMSWIMMIGIKDRMYPSM